MELQQLEDVVVPSDCKGCGSCCKAYAALIEPDEERLMDEKLYRPSSDDNHIMLAKPDGSCIALDNETNMCTIYEVRPRICRVFERGIPNCIKALRKFPKSIN